MIAYFYWGGGMFCLIGRIYFFIRCLNFRDLLRYFGLKWGLVFLLFFPVSMISGPSYDDIFKQVFGRIPEKQYFSQQMALIVDDEYVGDDIQVFVPTIGSDYKVFSYTLLKHLYATQKKGTVRELTLKIDEDGMLKAEDINELGYKIMVDRRAFKVIVSVPAEYRRKIIYYIMGDPEPILTGSASLMRSPANLSAYLNYSFSTNFLNSQDPEADTGMSPPVGSFYGISKTGQYSLNYAGGLDMAAMQKVNLSNLNIQKDLGERNERWTLGQVNPLTKGSMSSVSLMGLGYTTGPVLNLIGNFSPQFSHVIDLDKDSLVEIHINYRKVKELELEGGVYELRGFPLRTGFNIVKIVKITKYPVPEPTKESLIDDGVYNDINEGVMYFTKGKKHETNLGQTMRLHRKRTLTSEWLISDKIPRKGQVIDEDLPPKPEVVTTEFLFPFSVDPVLYAPSHIEWSYAMGYPMFWAGFSPELQEAFTHSFYVKKGLNKFITATGYTQVNDSHLLVGNELYVSSPFGPVFLNNALKKTKDVARLGGFSKASFMTYPIYSDPQQWFKLMSFGVSGSVRTPRFLSFGVTRPVLHENLLFQYAGSVSYQLRSLFSGTIQYSETKSLKGVSAGDVRQFSLIFQRKLPFGFGFSSSYQHNVGREVVDPQLITFKLSWSGFDGLAVSSMLKETVGTQDVQWSASYPKDFMDGKLVTATSAHQSLEKRSFGTALKYGGHSGSLSYVDSDLQTDQQVGYVLNNQRFNSNVSYLSRQIDGVPTSVFSLSAESSFVYADNHFAISTPIQDSYAIFSADDSLMGDEVYVGEEGRKIDWLGSTVLPSLRDRVITDVLIDVPSLSVGSEIDRLHSFRPVNFNAYLVELHVTPSVMLMGKLLKPNNKKARYLRGVVKSPEDPSIEERLITSRSGIFQVPNLMPGRYILSFGRKPYQNVPIDIPKDANGLYRLDTILLKSKSRDKVKNEKTALEEQIEASKEAKKKQVDAVDEVPQMDLLQVLIDDVLAEKIDEFVEEIPVEEETVESGPVDSSEQPPPQMEYVVDSKDMNAVERAHYLHSLKKEVNQFVKDQKEDASTVKDSLTILTKIHQYYLMNYEPKKARNKLFNDQLRPTSEQAILVHKKRERLRLKHDKRVSSDAIEESRKMHQENVRSKGIEKSMKVHKEKDASTVIEDSKKMHQKNANSTAIEESRKAHQKNANSTTIEDSKKAHQKNANSTAIEESKKMHQKNVGSTRIEDLKKAHQKNATSNVLKESMNIHLKRQDE